MSPLVNDNLELYKGPLLSTDIHTIALLRKQQGWAPRSSRLRLCGTNLRDSGFVQLCKATPDNHRPMEQASHGDFVELWLAHVIKDESGQLRRTDEREPASVSTVVCASDVHERVDHSFGRERD